MCSVLSTRIFWTGRIRECGDAVDRGRNANWRQVSFCSRCVGQAGSRQQAAGSSETQKHKTCTSTQLRGTGTGAGGWPSTSPPSEIAPDQPHGMAATPSRAPPLPWSALVRLTIGPRTLNAHRGVVARRTQSWPIVRWRSDFDLGIVKSRLSQLVFSCHQPSQASPSVHPLHPSTIRAWLEVPSWCGPLPKRSLINNEQSTAISKPAACIIASVSCLTRTPYSIFFAWSCPS